MTAYDTVSHKVGRQSGDRLSRTAQAARHPSGGPVFFKALQDVWIVA